MLTILVHPTMTSLSSLDLSLKEEEIINTESYKQSKVLLFKGIPENVKELEILNICHTFGIVKDILVIRHKKYAFVQFEV